MHRSESCASGPLPLRSTSPPPLTCRSCPSLVGESSYPKSLSYARSESLGSTWSLRTVAYLNLCPWCTWSKSFGAAPPSLCGRSPYYVMPMCRWPPSTGKSQVLLCAATFKFCGHLSIAFSWSLAFSRPKNGPDRVSFRHSAVKRRSPRTARRATRRHCVSDGPSTPLLCLQGCTML